MRLLILNGNTVANVIEVDPTAIPPEFSTAPVAPEGVGVGMVWDGANYVEPDAAPATSDHVDAERDRRLAAGVIVTVTGYGDIAVQGRVQDAVNYLALQSKAAKLDGQGVTDPVMPFRDRDNLMHNLTPAQVVELIDAGVGHAQAIYASAWALKDADPIPQDYTADAHWP